MNLISNPSPGIATRAAADAAICSRIAFQVGDISFGISSQCGLRLALEPGLLEFASAESSCDLEIETLWSDHLKLPSTAPAFRSGGLWSAWQKNDGLSLYFQTAYLGSSPYKKAQFDSTFTRGRVYLAKRYFDPCLPIYPLEYPLDELLMIHRLSQGEGIEIHACGVRAADGRGFLFVGHSGAGKSTTSRLWQEIPGTCVLSDDRIIIRRRNACLRMYGTPWHGDAGLAAQASSRIDHILLLEHGSRNEIIPLDSARAAAELFARTFVLHYSASALAHALQFTETLTRSVPISIFRFVPDQKAVEAILRAA